MYANLFFITPTTAAATTTTSNFCCNANPCPNDSNSCWSNYETTCGDYETAQANCNNNSGK